MPKGQGAKKRIFLGGAAQGSPEDRIAKAKQNIQNTFDNTKEVEDFIVEKLPEATTAAKVLVSFISGENKGVKDYDLNKASKFLYSFSSYFGDKICEITSKYFLLLGETFYKRWEKASEKKLIEQTHYLEMAEECLNTALKQFNIKDSFKNDTKPEQTNAHHKLAEIYLHKHDYDSWLKCANELVTNNPKNSQVLLFTAQHYIHFGKLQESHKLLQKVYNAERGNKLLIQVVRLYKEKFESAGYEVEEMLTTPQSPESKLKAQVEKMRADLEATKKERAEAEAAAAQAKTVAEEASVQSENVQQELARIQSDKAAIQKEAKNAQDFAVKLAMQIPNLQQQIYEAASREEDLVSAVAAIRAQSQQTAQFAAAQAFADGYNSAAASSQNHSPLSTFYKHEDGTQCTAIGCEFTHEVGFY